MMTGARWKPNDIKVVVNDRLLFAAFDHAYGAPNVTFKRSNDLDSDSFKNVVARS